MSFEKLLKLRTRVRINGQIGMVVGRTREERPVYDVMMSDGRILASRPRETIAVETENRALETAGDGPPVA